MKAINNAVIAWVERPKQATTINAFSVADCFLLRASQFAMTASVKIKTTLFPTLFKQQNNLSRAIIVHTLINLITLFFLFVLMENKVSKLRHWQ
ncbi:MAG: hypothetical protein LBE13_10875 [Bacteroidales bacterium]|nr:hypothetical protein [Bacteroidales bacterium]